MKTWITYLSAFFLMFALVGEVQAKRFGSGGFGKSFSMPSRSAPAKQQPTKQPTKQDQAQPGRSGGLMGGMLGGLLAGGLFAYLLGSGAFEGLQIMDILLFAGLAFLLFKLLRGSAARASAQPRSATYPPHTEAHAFQSEQDTQSSGAAANHQQPAMDVPADFDADAFIEGALSHYRLVQTAWNDGNLELIREYVSAPLFDALAAQRDRLMVPPQTEILDLNAEIVRAENHADRREISVLFRGRCKDDLEKSEDGIFDLWHLERDLSVDDAPWLIVGIEAE